MQEPIQSLEEVQLIEDIQPDLETNAQDLESLLKRTSLDTPTKEFSKEVRTSSLNDHTPSTLRRIFRLSSQYPPKNIINDPNKGTQTRSSLKNLCAFSTFASLVEPMDVKEAIKEPKWIISMQSELNEFEKNKEWDLVGKPKDRTIIGTR